jgi:phosphoribosylaminoimidazolecarboxamide formyltransferase/IMP cyclohydrolase
MTGTKNALLSVYDKTGIAEFAKGLAELGWTIYASGGTAKTVQSAGVPVKDVTELVGGEAILGHRVVTLSREIHAGLLADDSPEHADELARLNIPRIDLVCVDMYPLEAAINASGSTEAKVIEMTDIGGPTMLHSAAKGRRIVLSRAEQRSVVLKWLQNGQPDQTAFLHQLAAAAELEVACYILESAKYLNGREASGFISQRDLTTRYGENPWQADAGLFRTDNGADKLALTNFKVVSGTALSFTNYTDVDRLLQTITHVAAVIDRNNGRVPAIALGAKHGNVCGTGTSEDPAEAIRKMLEGDLRAIFGGSLMLNVPVTKLLAEVLLHHEMERGRRLLDLVVAPSFDDEAIQLLQRKNGMLRLVANPALADLSEASLDTAQRFRFVRGGFLMQDNYTFVFDFTNPELKFYGRDLSDQQKADISLAWAIGSTSNSNTITIVRDGKLLGNGVGQQDRVSAAELALKRARDAGHDVSGAVAYSDSFFPFPDAPDKLAAAGVTAILTSSGSVKDKDVVAAMEKAGVSLVMISDAAGRGFFNH